MAKRKRLSLPGSPEPEADAPLPPAGQRAPETKAMHPFSAAPAAAVSPISRVAGDAAATAALQDLADEVARARAEGRLVQALPLSMVDEGWLVRDRLAVDPDDLASLTESLRSHGQRMAIEVVDRGQGTQPRYGLISGWRRLAALRQLHEETAEARFATVLAVLRRPETAGDAYVAMVEENEIRAGLSYYERARIAAMAVEAGVFPTTRIALQRLYASASRSRRSKIGSFLQVHGALGAVLRFPEAIPERLGLALAMRLEAEPGFAAALTAALTGTAAPNAAAEIALLTQGLKARPAKEGSDKAGKLRVEVSPTLTLSYVPGAKGGEISLTGAAVDEALRERLLSWLQAAGAASS